MIRKQKIFQTRAVIGESIFGEHCFNSKSSFRCIICQRAISSRSSSSMCYMTLVLGIGRITFTRCSFHFRCLLKLPCREYYDDDIIFLWNTFCWMPEWNWLNRQMKYWFLVYFMIAFIFVCFHFVYGKDEHEFNRSTSGLISIKANVIMINFSFQELSNGA